MSGFLRPFRFISEAVVLLYFFAMPLTYLRFKFHPTVLPALLPLETCR